MKKTVPALIAAILASISFGSLACNVGHDQPQASGSAKAAAGGAPKRAATKDALKSAKHGQAPMVRGEKALNHPAGKSVGQDLPIR